MSLFFKDPKTCMNPWKGLLIIVVVCSFVIIALLIGKMRHESAIKQSMGFNDQNTATLNSELRF